MGIFSQAPGVSVNTTWTHTDFLSSHYYPVIAFLDGENPHDRDRFLALYPANDPYGPFLPINLLIHLPFALFPPMTAGRVYFAFTVLLMLPLSYLVLRLAELDVNRNRVMAIAGIALLTRPGHWTLLLGQGSVLLTLASYLALLYARRAPIGSGLALTVSVLKPTFGLPLGMLMLARRHIRAVAIGVMLSLAINLPLYAALAAREGGVGRFVEVTSTGLRAAYESVNTNPATSPHRLDPTALLSRALGRPLSSVSQLALAGGMLVLAVIALSRLARVPGRRSDDLSIAIICLSIALFASHLGYDLLILAAPLAIVVSRGLPEPASALARWVFLGLYAVPGLNWLATDTVLAAWQPSPAVWLLVVSVNGFCVLALFLGYLGLAWRGTDTLSSVRSTGGAAIPPLSRERH